MCDGDLYEFLLDICDSYSECKDCIFNEICSEYTLQDIKGKLEVMYRHYKER